MVVFKNLGLWMEGGRRERAGAARIAEICFLTKFKTSSKSWRGEKLAELRSLIHDAEPDVQEGWMMRGTPVWSYNGILLVGDGCTRTKSKLTFHSGAALR